MYKQKVKTTLNQADQLFQIALEEMSRPEEDVVPYLVCRNAFKSVNKYLTAFLLSNGISIQASMSLEVLLARCREINPTFNDLQLEPFYSTSNVEDVWMDIDTAREYMALANQTREIMLEGTKTHSLHFSWK